MTPTRPILALNCHPFGIARLCRSLPFALQTLAVFVALSVVLETMPQVAAQPLVNSKHSDRSDKFYPLDHLMPTPTTERLASGAPGPGYWQQRVDYDIDVTLDDEQQTIRGTVRMNYQNRSPHPLSYLWVQLDQNHFRPEADSVATATAPTLTPKINFDTLQSILMRQSFPGGFELSRVVDGEGNPLDHTVVKTMMRIDLDRPLMPGQDQMVVIDYRYKIVNAKKIRARGGYEYFEDDDNYIYEISQWYPRAAAYTDYQGWQNKQFLGRGEFTLELGDFRVAITLPADMVVTATGTLQNPVECLSTEQIQRLGQARGASEPVYIITPEEAEANQTERNDSPGEKTWIFEAEEVRDFAFAASRKFVWDAMSVTSGDREVLAMSLYPPEANPLWHQYSTEAIVHTIEVYNRYAFDYPYPVAISVNGPVYGMEYPMICFNGPRPEDDGTYSKKTKYGLISVIIHEVGHNYFPMIVNSDERKWTWMDEGLNTFLQFLAEQEWEEDYPSRRGDPENIATYMRGGRQRPIMTSSEEILQFGNNAYGKPATALNILRETVMGREAFDHAFATYSRRWKFRRPTPADFFRSMEDASGMDLDWFWRGWFYSTDHVDIGIEDVTWLVIDPGDPDAEAERKRKEKSKREPTVTKSRNAKLRKRLDLNPGLKDFYNGPEYDELSVEEPSRKKYQEFLDSLDKDQRAMLNRSSNFYVIEFVNRGGLVMPIIFRAHYTDGSEQLHRIPAQIWRLDSNRVRKLLITEKELQRIELDPFRETADTSEANNFWPPKLEKTRFQLFKEKTEKNPMQKAQAVDEKEPDSKTDSASVDP